MDAIEPDNNKDIIEILDNAIDVSKNNSNIAREYIESNQNMHDLAIYTKKFLTNNSSGLNYLLLDPLKHGINM